MGPPTCLVRGRACSLVPYRPEHVPLYHEWMQDVELQEATASEPLSLEEEYEAQHSWVNDPHKCTFIVLDHDLPDTPGTGRHGGGMAGDVNLFWNDHDDPNAAEIMVMVAEKQSRRKGIAGEALRLLMAYAASQRGVTRFVAKIGFANEASQALFAKLGYKAVKRSEVFKEVDMELGQSSEGWAAVAKAAAALQLAPYDEAG